MTLRKENDCFVNWPFVRSVAQVARVDVAEEEYLPNGGWGGTYYGGNFFYCQPLISQGYCFLKVPVNTAILFTAIFHVLFVATTKQMCGIATWGKIARMTGVFPWLQGAVCQLKSYIVRRLHEFFGAKFAAAIGEFCFAYPGPTFIGATSIHFLPETLTKGAQGASYVLTAFPGALPGTIGAVLTRESQERCTTDRANFLKHKPSPLWFLRMVRGNWNGVSSVSSSMIGRTLAARKIITQCEGV